MAKSRTKPAIMTRGVAYIEAGPLSRTEEGFQFVEFHFLTDCKFSEITPSPGYAIKGLEGKTVQAGAQLRIGVKAFRLSAGVMLAYFEPISMATVDKLPETEYLEV